MADNVAITAGVGTSVATDDVSGVHYQRVKLVNGTLDATDAIPGDATNGLDVDVTRITGGGVAHDSPDSGNPVKVGARARSADIAAVSSDDRVDLISSLTGALVTSPYSIPEDSVSGSGNSTGTGDTSVIASAGAGVRNYVTTIIVYNASTTNTYVNIKDGSTTKLVVPAPAGGGAVITLPKPLRGSAATAWNFASGTGVTTMYVSMVGYKGA